MAKYIMDVFFDVPSGLCATIPDDFRSAITSPVDIDRVDKPTECDECLSVRISLEGTDSWCQRTARTMPITINGRKFKAKSYEVVHCQG